MLSNLIILMNKTSILKDLMNLIVSYILHNPTTNLTQPFLWGKHEEGKVYHESILILIKLILMSDMHIV